MIIRIDHALEEPLYLQIRAQIIAGIATGELAAGQPLPSVRSLASDLGINLHTVNKAYAVLRDEGYVIMRGRSGAFIADANKSVQADKQQAELGKMEQELFELALAHRARGGSWGSFLECAQAQAARAYGVGAGAREGAGEGGAANASARGRAGVSSGVVAPSTEIR